MIGPVVVTIAVPAVIGWMIARVKGAIVGAVLGVVWLLLLVLGNDDEED